MLLPVGLVVGLLVLALVGLIVGPPGGGAPEPEAGAPGGGTQAEPPSVPDRATGPLNDLIVSSIVSITTYQNEQRCSGGSGSVVGRDRYILTNLHVVESDGDCRVDEIRIQTVGDSSQRPRDMFLATIVARDEEADLALLTYEPLTEDPPVLVPLALAVTRNVGQDIVVVGFPSVGGDSVTVSKGIIAGFVSDNGVEWMKTDAALSGGNSGGAALDISNRLVGVPTQFSQSEDGTIADCRNAADTNGDGYIDETDICVGIGANFVLMATASRVERFAIAHGIDLSID